MIFKSKLGLESLKELVVDESLDVNQGEKIGPDAATLLGLGVVSCLSASFIFCLNKRKLTLDDLEAKAEISFKENEKKVMRIEKIKVNLMPKTGDPSVLKRVKQCMKELKSGHRLFEESCIITASVREGIDVDVSIDI